MTKRIVFIGAGNIGRAIGNILLKKGEYEVQFWDVDPQKVPDQKPLSEILPTADIVFFCIPSWVLRDGFAETKAYIQSQTALLSVAKGIEASTKFTVDQMFKDAFPENSVGLIYGPMLADELSQDHVGMGVLASSDERVRSLAALFKGSSLILESSDDIHGVALAGVLKNVYALGLGILAPLGFGENAGGWYIATALREMAGIIELLGGRRDTAYGPAGLADFVATAFSSHSKNRQVGEEFAKTGAFTQKSEGLLALPSLVVLLGETHAQFPLLGALTKIVAKEGGPKELFTGVMRGET